MRQVRGALNHFETTRMLTRSVTYHHTMLTVLNWSTYQDCMATDDKLNDTRDDISRASRGQQYKKVIRKEEASTGIEERIPENAKVPEWL